MKILLLNQAFHPDVVATAQLLTDAAQALARHGHEVTVIASRRAYDDSTRTFPAREDWRGIRIIRIGNTAFGKSAKWRRAADFASFIVACVWQLLWRSRPDAVVALTSPPLISFIGAWFAKLRGAKFFYWVMDLNPDEAIAAGWLREGSFAARGLHRMSRFSLRRAEKIIALDRFMRARIEAKGIADVKEPVAELGRPRRVGAHGLQGVAELDKAVGPLPPAGAGSGGESKIVVIPPWSHDEAVRFDSAGREAFRQAHGLGDKFVVMYSGNHSPCHPLDTLLDAARKLSQDPRFVFLFVGGGSEFRKIQKLAGGQRAEDGERRTDKKGQNPQPSTLKSQPPTTGDPQPSTLNSQLPSSISHLPSSNLLCLPYQPLDQLSASLSAADLHVVVMGDPFVGVVHPCKIYNVLSVGAPILYVGPRPSHLSEALETLDSKVCGTAAHGEGERCVTEIRRIAAQNQRGEAERYAKVAREFSQTVLLPRLVAELERV